MIDILLKTLLWWVAYCVAVVFFGTLLFMWIESEPEEEKKETRIEAAGRLAVVICIVQAMIFLLTTARWIAKGML